MKTAAITLSVTSSDDGVEGIVWRADEAESPEAREAKAFMLSLWDGRESRAMRIDLWTRDMSVDDMNDFFFQTLMTMADTYARATTFGPLAGDIKVFAQEFAEKAARATRRSMGSSG